MRSFDDPFLFIIARLENAKERKAQVTLSRPFPFTMYVSSCFIAPSRIISGLGGRAF
ncbi:hypothetical protein [Thermococcus pacificus]|uniref:hypothetical protein n=1 Tax=Thermococcus pacificus TaxID=71998 RepID=UPI0018DEF4D9|nr:hypothetical protein [Thermococcus pacificus]